MMHTSQDHDIFILEVVLRDKNIFGRDITVITHVPRAAICHSIMQQWVEKKASRHYRTWLHVSECALRWLRLLILLGMRSCENFSRDYT